MDFQGYKVPELYLLGTSYSEGHPSMKKNWSVDDLIDHFTLTSSDLDWLRGQAAYNQLGSAIFLKFFEYQGRFPQHQGQVASDIVEFVAQQLGIHATDFERYPWAGRTGSRNREAIYKRLGIRDATVEDADQMSVWLSQHPILYEDQRLDVLVEILYEACRQRKLVPPTRKRLERIVNSAVARHEKGFFEQTTSKLSGASRLALDNLTYPDETLPTDYVDGTVMGWLKSDPSQTSVAALKATADRLQRLQAIDLPDHLFASTATRVVETYARRAASEPPRELRRRQMETRFTLLAAFCWVRQRDITDQL
ncbi:MAG: DUF4158 domain-containing protein, partial [Chloroflexota bacterium]